MIDLGIKEWLIENEEIDIIDLSLGFPNLEEIYFDHQKTFITKETSIGVFNILRNRTGSRPLSRAVRNVYSLQRLFIHYNL